MEVFLGLESSGSAGTLLFASGPTMIFCLSHNSVIWDNGALKTQRNPHLSIGFNSLVLKIVLSCCSSQVQLTILGPTVVSIPILPSLFIHFWLNQLASHLGEFHQMNDSTDCEYHKLASSDSVRCPSSAAPRRAAGRAARSSELEVSPSLVA